MSAKAAEFFTYIAMSALDAAWSSKPAEPAIPSDAAIRRIVAERVKTIAGAVTVSALWLESLVPTGRESSPMATRAAVAESNFATQQIPLLQLFLFKDMRLSALTTNVQ